MRDTLPGGARRLAAAPAGRRGPRKDGCDLGMRFWRIRRAGGFTLIEIMIVIAVIGILAGVAVHNYNRARQKARKEACTQTLKTIESSAELWLMENRVPNNTPVNMEDMLKSGQLKTRPVCPSGGSFTVTVQAAQEGSYAGHIHVKCSVHGTHDDNTTGL